MADTPPVAGPLPVWYTAAQQKRQFMGGWPPDRLFVGHTTPLDYLANPPAGGIVAENAIDAFSNAAAAGTWVYPEPVNGWVD